MELLKEVLTTIITKEEINITFPNLKINIAEIIETECYKALQKIKNIIEDDTLSEFECIEEIVCVLEDINSNGGNRHNFG